MKAKDVVKQLIENEPSGWDYIETMAFQYYDAQVQGVVYKCVSVDFESGMVACYVNFDEDCIEEIKPTKSFAIKAELVELTEE